MEYNPQGGNTVRNHLWMKECHPVSRKAFCSFIDIHILETQHCNTVLYSIYLILDTGMFEPRETNLRAFLSVSHQHQSWSFPIRIYPSQVLTLHNRAKVKQRLLGVVERPLCQHILTAHHEFCGNKVVVGMVRWQRTGTFRRWPIDSALYISIPMVDTAISLRHYWWHFL